MLTVVPCVAVCESTNRFARKRISSSYDDIALTVTPMQKDHKLSVTVANNNNNYYNNRFTTKDSYTWNITHNTGSTAVWSLTPERWGSPLVQEKYQEEKACDKRWRQHNNNNNNNNNKAYKACPFIWGTTNTQIFKPHVVFDHSISLHWYLPNGQISKK